MQEFTFQSRINNRYICMLQQNKKCEQDISVNAIDWWNKGIKNLRFLEFEHLISTKFVIYCVDLIPDCFFFTRMQTMYMRLLINKPCEFTIISSLHGQVLTYKIGRSNFL